MNKIKIDIVSDLVCPWCYIGQKRLNDALAQSDYEAEISWKPFQLHPELEKEGMEKNAFLFKKFGQQGANMFDQIKSVADSESLAMNPEKITNIPNTVDVHRLMWFAKKQHKDLKLANSLFEAYFTAGKDFSNPETLLDLAEACGLSRMETEAFLASEEGRTEVLAEEKMYREAGIQAVPTFIINDKYMIQGAQTPAVFLDAFKQLVLENQDQTFQCTGDNC
ncbi:MAG: DsbA family oxidoreductase [Bacteroidetes bacterium]|nr:DsbA family oxidoreductase [Bacteroidota bacterium]MBU1373081.1 DsbA family oxidoreductase [Bacteroidota bacterium]MBU1484262.1 DsbA family oxidoreductase [Bacteroidota bacterium]MBU1759945.1 DsbA family oxidoreductase [Bacteroidota bacterium]MBU2046435.1 DsbA family oxidoreductase [Bacteroidota bacterium]